MTVQHKLPHKHLIPLYTGVLLLILGFPALGWSTGYSDSHHSSGHGLSPHESGAYGHSQVPHGMSGYYGHGTFDGYGKGGSLHTSGHGHHQSASEFIEHILKFKEGMAITGEQAAKLQKINMDFKKTKIQMKADIQLASLDLHEALRNDEGDLSTVESQLKKVFEMKANLLLASVKAQREARDVLTDEQRSRMKAVHERINAYKGGGMMKGRRVRLSFNGQERKEQER